MKAGQLQMAAITRWTNVEGSFMQATTSQPHPPASCKNVLAPPCHLSTSMIPLVICINMCYLQIACQDLPHAHQQ
jgi:hypothetical protein